MYVYKLLFLYLIMIISIGLISYERSLKLQSFYRFTPSLKLASFEEKFKKIDKEDKQHLAFWYSMLSGNTIRLNKLYQAKYKNLGLSHIFTPSGFHLSTLLTPLKLLTPRSTHLYLLTLITIGMLFLPGMDALKRMGFIKTLQNPMGQNAGFYSGMAFALLIGQLTKSPLSFIFSFFFLGLIYSNLKGLGLLIWFFIGQILIAYLSGAQVSFLNLFLSPLGNMILSILTPILFLLSFPLWDWQLSLGIKVTRASDYLINELDGWGQIISGIEIHNWAIIMLTLLLLRKKYHFYFASFIYCFSLNLELPSKPLNHRYYFVPTGHEIKRIYNNEKIIEYYSDGKCEAKMRLGIWEKRCSPKRAPRNKKIKKLSYL